MNTVNSNSPYPVWEFENIQECFHAIPETFGVCDFCNISLANSKSYLIPVCSSLVCPSCYESWLKTNSELDYENDEELKAEKEFSEENVNYWKERLLARGIII